MKELLKISLLAMFTLVATSTFAQTKEGEYEEYEEYEEDEPFEKSWKDQLVWGGNILPAYNNGWILEVSPFVGYKITNSTVAGVGVNYFYRSFRNPFFQNQPRQIWRIYGGRAFVMQELLFGIFAQAEYDYTYLNYKEKDVFDNVVSEGTAQAPGFLIGGGYNQSNGRIGYSITVLYDALYDPFTSTRPDPWVFRGGIIVGL